MDPGYRINNTLEYSYQNLVRKNSFFQKYPKHKRSSRLCLIAAERDSLKDLKDMKTHSKSLDSKKSNQIQILNFPLDSDLPIEYKAESSQKIKKELSLGKIIINKSSRIRDGGESQKNILTSEMYSINNLSKDNQKLYWTKNREKEKIEDISDINMGYSTLNKSRVIEVSYFPTNQNGNIFGDLDSTPKRFFQETVPSDKHSPPRAEIRNPLTPRVQKTSLSEFSNGSDQMIQDFLDRQIEKNSKSNKKEPLHLDYFKAKKNPLSMTLSVDDSASQHLCSLKHQDEKGETGFTFNIFDNKNIVKSEIFDTNKRKNLYLNFESENPDAKSNFFMTKMDNSAKMKSKKKIKKNKGGVKNTKNKANVKTKNCKTPKRERISKKFKFKSKTQILDAKRSVKSNLKPDKKKRKKKKLTLARHSVNLQSNQSIKDSFRYKIAKNKKKMGLKDKIGLKEHGKTLPTNQLNIKDIKSSKHFKRSGLRHKRTMSGVAGMMKALVINRKTKDKAILKTSKKNQTDKLYLKKSKSKSIKINPKKNLRIKVNQNSQVKMSKKKISLIETPIFKDSIKKLTFDKIG